MLVVNFAVLKESKKYILYKLAYILTPFCKHIHRQNVLLEQRTVTSQNFSVQPNKSEETLFSWCFSKFNKLGILSRIFKLNIVNYL